MQTPLQITYKGMGSSPALEGLIRERAARLERFHRNITGCRVVVEVPYRKSGTGKVPVCIVVEVDIPNHNVIIGKDAEERREMKEDQTAAVNNAFEAVERQLVKISDLQDRDLKQHEAAGENGVVASLFRDQNYGFIEVKDSPELYFTGNAVVGGSFDELEIGMMVHVTRATTEGPMGPQASSVRPLGRARSPV